MYLTIITYDIVDNKRRKKLADALLDYGTRVQYSVFEASIDNKQLKEIIEKVKECTVPDEDSVIIYRICRSCKKETHYYGKKKGFDIEKDCIII